MQDQQYEDLLTRMMAMEAASQLALALALMPVSQTTRLDIVSKLAGSVDFTATGNDEEMKRVVYAARERLNAHLSSAVKAAAALQPTSRI